MELPCLPGLGNKRKRGFANSENKKTREVKARRDIDVDRLSDLPDDVVFQIMSLLPIKETVRTSVLSTRWRDLFTSMSNLNIDDNNETRKSLCNSFMNIVDRVLFLRKRDIGVEKFRLKCGQAMDSFRINGWIQYALRYGVREFDLFIGTKGFNELQFGVFTSTTLVTLRLIVDQNFILKVPTNCCLPNLKVLHLGWLKFSDDDSVQRLFSSCFSLEELVVQKCELNNINKFSVCNPTLKRLIISGYMGNNYEVEINTPSLVYFKYFYMAAKGHSLINLSSLLEACIDIGPDINGSSNYTAAAIDLMRGISHVQSLHLNFQSSKAILLSGGLIPEFPNLTYLKMGSCYPGWETILASSPCLETLVFDFEFSGQELEWHINRITDLTEKVSSCLLYHLKAIKLLSFQGKQVELQVVEYLLKNAKVLESLTVRIRAKKRQQIKITKELCALPRVSKKCQVVII